MGMSSWTGVTSGGARRRWLFGPQAVTTGEHGADHQLHLMEQHERQEDQALKAPMGDARPDRLR